jgi:hypothetical protein
MTTPVNPLTQPGSFTERDTPEGDMHSRFDAAVHGGSYPHRPAPHLEPSPVIPPDHLEHLVVVADVEGQAEADTEAE